MAGVKILWDSVAWINDQAYRIFLLGPDIGHRSQLFYFFQHVQRLYPQDHHLQP